MSNWIKNLDSKIKPQTNIPVICSCPDWCISGYQIGYWNGREFRYENQPNDTFGKYVEMWRYLPED